MNVISIPVIITFAVNASLFLLTVLTKKRRCLNYWFAVFLFFFVLWNLSVFLALNEFYRVNAHSDILLGFNLIFLLPPLWLFVVDCYENHLYSVRFLEFHVLLILLLPLAILALGGLIVQLEFYRFIDDFQFFKLVVRRDWRYYFLMFFEIFSFLFGFYILHRKFRRAKSLSEHTGLIYFILGSLIFCWSYFEIVFLRGSAKSLYFYLLVIFLLPFYFYFFAFGGGYKYFGYASKINIKHIFYSSILATFYFLVIYYILIGLNVYFDINNFWIDAFLVFVMIFFIYPLRFPLQQILDKKLNKRIEELRQNVLDFMGELYKIYDNGELLPVAAASIEKNFKVPKITIFQRQKMGFIAVNQSFQGDVALDDIIISLLEKIKASLELYGVDCKKFESNECKLFMAQGFEIFLPIFNNEKLVVVLGIKEKLNKHKFNFEEIRLLDLLVNELSSLYSRNYLLAVIKAQEQKKAQVEKLAAMGQMTSVVAHEIRNPLNTIKMSAETLINKNLTPGQQKELQFYILDEAQRLNRILNEFLQYSKLPRPNLLCVDMNVFIAKIDRYLSNKSGQTGFRYRIVNRLETTKFVTDLDLLYQVMVNLIDNAIDAIKEKASQIKEFTGGILVYFYKKQQNLFIIVQDNGVAIRESDKTKIFSPFFTTKIKGTGLGLAITQNIVNSLSGEIVLLTKHRKKRFVIKLPEKFSQNEC